MNTRVKSTWPYRVDIEGFKHDVFTLQKWCEENCEDEYMVQGNLTVIICHFKKQTDAAYFAMRWL